MDCMVGIKTKEAHSQQLDSDSVQALSLRCVASVVFLTKKEIKFSSPSLLTFKSHQEAHFILC